MRACNRFTAWFPSDLRRSRRLRDCCETSPLVREPLVELLYLFGRVGPEKGAQWLPSGGETRIDFAWLRASKAVLPVVVTDAGSIQHLRSRIVSTNR